MSDDFDTKSNSEVVDVFRQAMEQTGIVTQDKIVADGALRRFHVRGEYKPGTKKWLVLPAPRPVPDWHVRHLEPNRAALKKSRIEAAARLEAEIAANQAKARAAHVGVGR